MAEATETEKRQRTRYPAFVGYLLLLAISVVALVLCALLLDRSDADGNACRVDGTAKAAAGGDGAPATEGEGTGGSSEPKLAGALAPESDSAAGAVVVFGRRGGARDVQLVLGPADPGTAASASEPPPVSVIGDVVREAGGDSLSSSVTASVKQQGSKYVLLVCVERGSAAAGTYKGTLEIGDDETTATFVPLEVRLSPSGWDAVLLAWLSWAAVVVAGMAFVYWSASPTEQAYADIKNTSASSFARLGYWLYTAPALAGLLAGLFAALGVFTAVFIADNSWGDDLLGDLTDLGSKMGAAFVALALTTYRLASKTRDEKPAST